MFNQLRCLCATLVFFLSVLSVSLAMAGTDAEEMSQQLLEFRFNSQDVSTLHQRIAESHAELRRRADQAPTKKAKAILLFSQPRLQAEVEELARRYNLEVTAVRHVTITRKRTFSGGFTTLDGFAGSLNQKLTFFTKRLLSSADEVIEGKLPFQQTAPESGVSQAAIGEVVEAFAERKQRITGEGLKFYEMQAVGALADLSHLQQVESSIAAVHLIKSPSIPKKLRKKLREKFPNGLPKLPLTLLEHSKVESQAASTGTRAFSHGSAQATPQNATAVMCDSHDDPDVLENCPPDNTFAPAKIEDGGWRGFSATLTPAYGGLVLGFITGGEFETWVQWSPQMDSSIVTNTAAFREITLPPCNPVLNVNEGSVANKNGRRTKTRQPIGLRRERIEHLGARLLLARLHFHLALLDHRHDFDAA